MNVVLKEIKEFNEFKKLFYNRNGFDDYFWEDILEEGEFASRESTINLAIISDKAVGLVEILENKDEGGIEINRLEIQDDFRESGYGRAIVNTLRESIGESVYLFGYSVSEAAEFWKKVSSSYDEEIYNMIVEQDYDCNFLMKFEI